MRMYACPKCGKPEASWDGITYCGSCEEQYRKEQQEADERELAEAREKIRSHADDCECPTCCFVSGLNPNR